MILFASGRTDIVGFYMPWFMKRLEAGYFDVRNPFNPKLVSRIYTKDVDAILFCTKNPRPLLDYIDQIAKPVIVHVTLTGYHTDFEPFVIKDDILDCLKELSSKIGSDRLYIRYDPIIVNDFYTIDYHIKALTKIAETLQGYIKTIIVSFVDDYKNVRRHANILQIQELTSLDYAQIGHSFSTIAHEHGMKIITCGERENLEEYGFDRGECMSFELASSLTGKSNFKEWKQRHNPYCHCVAMVDIGAYNTCLHLCQYCYANYDVARVQSNNKLHDPDSSLLIGHLEDDDVIKVRTN